MCKHISLELSQEMSLEEASEFRKKSNQHNEQTDTPEEIEFMKVASKIKSHNEETNVYFEFNDYRKLHSKEENINIHHNPKTISKEFSKNHKRLKMELCTTDFGIL